MVEVVQLEAADLVNLVNRDSRHFQKGSALIVSLVLLLVITLLAVAGMQNTTLQERMSGNYRDRDLAFQAAEYALRSGEARLEAATLPSFGGTEPGLIQVLPGGHAVQVWNGYSWDSASATPVHTAAFDVASAPRYVVEQLPPMPDPQSSLAVDEPVGDIEVFRITARATGGTADAVVILQSTYRR
ncbi:hypothetical protein M911_16365 [Ectothiorhodospira haloalkaliphila]|uniref:Pilus assembly protein PilX n=1 Tax=Ectothiorhodospira haloalkaliphila TaxID=421628 RepID=W8KY01_9GAMM|nr:hypothetical protein M911_16365 [Ectothiorhodospira haloalkaliphila]